MLHARAGLIRLDPAGFRDEDAETGLRCHQLAFLSVDGGPIRDLAVDRRGRRNALLTSCTADRAKARCRQAQSPPCMVPCTDYRLHAHVRRIRILFRLWGDVLDEKASAQQIATTSFVTTEDFLPIQSILSIIPADLSTTHHHCTPGARTVARRSLWSLSKLL